MKRTSLLQNIIIVLMAPAIVCSQTIDQSPDNNLIVPNVIEPDPPPTFTADVGTLPGNASINAVGAATYTIPIDLPPGTGGMVPSLSLSYNSMSGNGVMGMGWNLGGLSTVERTGQDRFNEGDYKAVSYSTSDRLVIDGKRLILKGGSWFGTGSQYRTQSESYNQITYNGNYFTVLTPKGDTIYYGLSPESRFKLDATKVLKWYISKVADAFGNSIIYTYQYISATNEVLIDKIEYTKSKNFAAYNKVQFNYSTGRTDYLKAFYSGIKYDGDRRLSTIQIYANGNLVKSYGFNYTVDDNDDSYLSLISLIGQSSEINDTKLTYIEKPERNSFSTFYTIYTHPAILQPGPIPVEVIEECHKASHLVLDIDGDRKSDLASTITINQDKTINFRYNELNSMVSLSMPANYTGFIPIDYNGDGKDELLFHKGIGTIPISGYSQETNLSYFGADSIYGGNSQFQLMKFENNSFSVISTTNNYGISGLSSVYYDIIQGDYDGNGMTDLLFITPGGSSASYKFFLSEIVSGSVSFVKRAEGVISFNGRFFVADFNGDGKLDLLHKGTTGIKYCTLNKVAGTSNYSLGSWISLSSSNSENIAISLGNINSDLQTDILDETNNKTYLLKGYGSTIAEIETNINFDNMSISADFNQDGKDDYQYLSTVITGSPETGFNVTYYTNRYYINGNTIAQQILSGDYAKINQYLYGDINGDGAFENIIDYTVVSGLAKRQARENLMIISFHTNDNNLVLSTVEDGMSNKTVYHYGYTTTSGIYTQNETSAAISPVKTINPKLMVVDSLNLSNGRDGFIKTIQRYENARTHIDGKGFLGFGKTTSTNLTSGIKTENTYTYHATTYDPLITSMLTSTTGNTRISGANYGYKYYSWATLGQKHYVIYPDTTSTYDHLSLFKQKTTYTFSTTYGSMTNIVKKSYVLSPLTEKESVSLVNTYESFLGGKFYRLKTTASTIIRPSQTYYKAQKSFNYFNTTSTKVSKEIIYYYDPVTGVEDADKDTINYNYSLLGNVNQVISQLGNIKRTTGYQYDTKERFVLTKTDPLGYTTIAAYDDLGMLTSLKDPNNITTTKVYDWLGNLLTVNNPDASDEAHSIQWVESGDNAAPEFGYYYYTVIVEGKPYIKTYYDRLGRALRTVTVAQNGKLIFTDVVYNEKGQQVKSSLPYFQGEIISWKYNEFDNIGRVKSIWIDDNIKKTTFTYDKNKVTQTMNNTGQVYSRTVDPTGLVIEVTDPGGTMIYDYYSSGNLKSVIAPSCTTSIEYDKYNTQKKLIDPNAGTIEYEHNAYGEIAYQKDARGNWLRYTKIDNAGRPVIKTSSDGNTVNYTYDTDFKGTLYSVSHSNGTTSQYLHNALGLITRQKETIEGVLYETIMDYDTYSRIQKITYPSAFNVNYTYTSNGYLSSVKHTNNTIALWSAGDVNALGEWKNFTLGSGISRTFTYNVYGMPDEIKTGSIQSLKYVFNMETGNLTSRKNVLRNLTENFTYNNLDQLSSWEVGGSTYSVGYKTDGTSRINTKTDAGTYVYGATPDIHQVTGIDNNPGTLNNTNAFVTYNSFNKIGSISETGAYRQDFTYAADEHRRVSKLYNSSGVLKKETIYVPGGYEVEKRGTYTRRLHYIPVGDCWALYTKNSAGADSLYFLLTDHLGSVHVITNASGAVQKEMSFDPWGRRRNPVDWTYNSVPAVSITSRGFTMHEHMDPFKLINMNGRVYDPVLGQFLSPDPFVSNPASTASYNRYAYCNYNPLKYVDPSGFVKTMKGMEPVVILSTMGYVGNYSVHGGSYNPSTAALNAAFYGSHTFVSNGHGGGQWVTNDNVAQYLWDSEYGGHWSANGPSFTFSDGDIAMVVGIDYVNSHDAWGNTVNKTPEATRVDYIIRTNTGNLTASLGEPPPSGDGGDPNYWLGKTVPFAITSSAADGPLPIGEALAATALTIAAVHDATVATKRYLNQQGVQYTLRTSSGDIWKIGQTTQYDFSTGKQWRYPQSQLDAWGVTFLPEFPGNRLEILAVEKMKIWNYIHTYNALPPGNKVPW